MGSSRFTPEQRAWVRTLYPGHGAHETARLLNARFGASFTPRQIGALMAAGQRDRWLTPELEQWLRAHIHERSIAGSCAEIERVFGVRVSVAQLKAANSNHEFGRVNRSVPRPNQRLFSDAERAWLRAHYPRHAPSETLILFNETWKRSITREQLAAAQQRYRLPPSPYDGKIRPGDPRCGNSGPEQKAAFLEASKATRFRKGHVPPNRVPLYTERVSHVGGRRYLEIKVPGASPNPAKRALKTDQKTHWVGKGRWVWERENGPVPEGHVVVMLDGDPMNCEPDNLECVPRGVLARLNHRHAAPYAGAEINPARIRIAQIRQAVADVQRAPNRRTEEVRTDG